MIPDDITKETDIFVTVSGFANDATIAVTAVKGDTTISNPDNTGNGDYNLFPLTDGEWVISRHRRHQHLKLPYGDGGYH